MNERECARCGRVYLVVNQRGQAPRFCTTFCRREAGRVDVSKRRRVFGDFQRTPLNIETDRRFRACGGQHVPSGDYVVRDVERKDIAMPVCANCGVPYKGAYVSWNAKKKYDYDADPTAFAEGGSAA